MSGIISDGRARRLAIIWASEDLRTLTGDEQVSLFAWVLNFLDSHSMLVMANGLGLSYAVAQDLAAVACNGVLEVELHKGGVWP